jgi:hypothetical protein
MNYLDKLPISADEKAKLRPLGAPTPAALLGLIQASPEQFGRFFGPQRTGQLVRLLTSVLTEGERKSLSQPVPRYAIQSPAYSVSSAPTLPPTPYDLEQRDRLFEHLRQLRADTHPSKETLEEIAACEAKLNAMLDTTG